MTGDRTTDLDGRLRAALRDERWALPAPPDVLDEIETGARRLRRRRTSRTAAGAVAVAAAIIVAVALTGMPGGGDGARPPRPMTSVTLPLPVPGGHADQLIATSDSLYVRGGGRVYRLDRAAGRFVAVSPPSTASPKDQLLVADGRLWVAPRITTPGRPHNLDRLDPYSLKRGNRTRLDAGDRTTGTTEATGPTWTTGTTGTTGTADGSLWTAGSASAASAPRRRVFTLRDPASGLPRRVVHTPWGCLGIGGVVDVDAEADRAVVWCVIRPSESRMALLSMTADSAIQQLPWPATLDVVPAWNRHLWRVEHAGWGLRFVHLVVGDKVAEAPGGDLGALPAPPDVQAHGLGSRLWIYSPEQHRLSCFDRRTGARLATYPAPYGSGKLALAGDEKGVYFAHDGKLTMLDGPDACLS
ncbi:hypothetical protein SMC26_27850 [Actinomadura fulvescens]|uniref:Uncharacterized protein n=1 Tax=Actinomadura fulvescens TaxID=46160 RepID=A0ABN3PA65_9ACTN